MENLRRDVRKRVESDKLMSTAWLLVYLIPIGSIALLVFSIALAPMAGPPWVKPAAPFAVSLMILSTILGISAFITTLVLLYKLVNRRNMHFRRQLLLFEDIVRAVREAANRKGVDVSLHLGMCERTIREAKVEETEKNAVLWAILSAITGIAALYVYYFLMKDFYRHERREDSFLEDLGKALAACGITFIPRRDYQIPDRSFVLYLIITILTLGIFGIYWLYILIKDPNEHFKYHAIFEDYLLKQLETTV